MFSPNDSPHEDPPVPGGYTGINPYADRTGFVPITYMGETPVYSSDPNYVPPLMDPGHIAALMGQVNGSITSSYVASSQQLVCTETITLADGSRFIPVAEYDSVVEKINTLQKKFDTEHETCDKLRAEVSRLSRMFNDVNRTLNNVSAVIEAHSNDSA